jgi:hypothetical protein
MNKYFAGLFLLLLVSSANASIISLSNAYVDQSGYGKINGDVYIGEWRSTPTSTDQLVVQFDSSSVSKSTGKTYTVSQPAIVELTDSYYGAAYTFSNPDPVYNVDYVKGKLPGFYVSSNSCKLGVESYFATNFPITYAGTYFLNFGSCEYYAWVGANLEGYIANVNFDQREFVNTWTVTQGSEAGQITLSAQKNKPTVLSQWYDDKLFINYQGSVNWLFKEPSAANVKGFYDKKTNTWRVVNFADFDKFDDGVNSLYASDPYTFRSVSSADAQLDTDFARLRSSVLPNEWTSSNVVKRTVSGTSQNDGEVKVELTGGVSIPTFKMIIDADWVGIKSTAGAPTIVSVSSNPFSEGNTGLIDVTVKNSGNGKGGFNLQTQCNSGFSGTSQQFTLDAGKTASYSLGVQAKNSALITDLKGSCDVTLTETNTGVSVKKTVSVTAKSLQSCTPGEEQAFKDTNDVWGIKTCDANGQTFKVTKTCATLEIVQRSETTGKLACFRPDSSQAPDTTDKEFNAVLFWIAAVLGLVAGGASGFFASKAVDSTETKIVVGLVIGVIVGVLVLVGVGLAFGSVIDTFSYGLAIMGVA